MAKLVISEKPSVAGDIARALGVNKNHNIYENDEWVISNAIGHLVELVVPEAVPGAPLPILPAQFSLKANEKTEHQLNVLKYQLKRAHITTIVNACDAGREGEHIFRLIMEICDNKKPIERAWLQSMTQGAIKAEFQALRPGSAYDTLADAARCRAEADWLVGINASRALSRRQQYGTNAGRVQTPTLSIVVERELAIMNFKPSDYFELHGTFGVAAGQYVGKWQNPNPESDDPKDRTLHRSVADAIVKKCTGAPVDSVTEETKAAQRLAPQLYSLTDLQRDANRKLGLSAQETLTIAQALYERHKVLTYPRTDSSCLPEDYAPTAQGVVESLMGVDAFKTDAQRVIDGNWVTAKNKRIFDDSKISDHFAITPTGAMPNGLSEVELQVFSLVVKRFLAAFHPAAQFADTTRFTLVAAETFKSTGRVLVSPGWLAVYGGIDLAEDEDKEQIPALRPYVAGEAVSNDRMDVKVLKTKPPKRFTEASLLGAMEGAGKELDAEMKAAMAGKGIGTPATRASTIEGLLKAVDGKGNPKEPYMRRNLKSLVPTQKGISLVGLLHEKKLPLTSAELTGEWEHKLDLVQQGKLTRPDFMAQVHDLTTHIVTVLDAAGAQPAGPRIYTPRGEELCACPKCKTGKVLLSEKTASCICGFNVWVTIAQKKLTKAQVTALLTKSETGTVKGFTSKAGKPFDAQLKLNRETWQANFLFATR